MKGGTQFRIHPLGGLSFKSEASKVAWAICSSSAVEKSGDDRYAA